MRVDYYDKHDYDIYSLYTQRVPRIIHHTIHHWYGMFWCVTPEHTIITHKGLCVSQYHQHNLIAYESGARRILV